MKGFGHSITAMASIAAATVALCVSAALAVGHYFGIQVTDDVTGRGVPMVELRCTDGASYYTDSAGWVAFYEPGLMNRRVYFGVTAHGYTIQPDGLGSRGRVFTTTPGQEGKIAIHRTNIAERLYRMTGVGIYRDSFLLKKPVPIREPLLNAEVAGQDGILTALYRGKLFWFYGDTSRVAYPLGNFSMSGAVSDPPAQLKPDVGINLRYFVRNDGFAKAMCPLPGEGVVWLSGLVVLPDEAGNEKMAAFYQRRRGLGKVLENGFVVYDDAAEQFKLVRPIPLIDPPGVPTGYPSRVGEFYYFTCPYPMLRVKATLNAYLNLAEYEGFTCLKPGSRYAQSLTELDRSEQGRLIWGWKRDTPPLKPAELDALVAAGVMKTDENPNRLADALTGHPIHLNNCSCFWNEHRKKYIMIASEGMGASMLGEVWYAEADQPEGPWGKAVKIITHADLPGDPHDFYNPTQHPFLDEQGGRVIYLEGSYVNTFSGNPRVTPYYEYNQIMYRLDLDDPRLRPAHAGAASVNPAAKGESPATRSR